MNPIDLPNHGYGRLLMDSLRDAAGGHPELFGFPDPDDDAAYLPLGVGDKVLELRVGGILEVESTHMCTHVRAVEERVEADGIKFYPDGVLLGCAIYRVATLPQAVLCSLCWSKYLPIARKAAERRPCERCGTGQLPRDPAVVLTAVAHGIFTFFCCTYCVEDLGGGDSDE